MRPTLNVLSDELIARILDEAMGILANVGMEIRGPLMRQRLIDAGLPTDRAGGRVLFPREVVERAIETRAFVVHPVRPGRQAARRHRRRPGPFHPGLERA